MIGLGCKNCSATINKKSIRNIHQINSVLCQTVTMLTSVFRGLYANFEETIFFVEKLILSTVI